MSTYCCYHLLPVNRLTFNALQRPRCQAAMAYSNGGMCDEARGLDSLPIFLGYRITMKYNEFGFKHIGAIY